MLLKNRAGFVILLILALCFVDHCSASKRLWSVSSVAHTTHLVVPAGSVGTYSIEGENTLGLLLCFSAVSNLSTFDVLHFNESMACLCAGLQYRSNTNGKFTVEHDAYSSSGYICASADGTTYTPTNVTYEIAAIQPIGFRAVTKKEFSYNRFEDAEVTTNVGFPMGGSGITQLVLKYQDENTLVEIGDVRVSKIRFTLNSDCSPYPGTLLLESTDVSKVGDNFFFDYEVANVHLHSPNTSRLNIVQSYQTYRSFYVCVALAGPSVQKSMSLRNEVFAMIPGLSAYPRAPTVKPYGMWTISPQNDVIVMKRRRDFPNRFSVVSRNGTLSSATRLHVPQYSSPIVGLELGNYISGMAVRLVRSSSDCRSDMQQDAVSISSAEVHVVNGAHAYTEERMLPFFQLTLNHTSLSFEETDAIEWFFCLAPSVYLPQQSLLNWSIVVHRDPFFTPNLNDDLPMVSMPLTLTVRAVVPGVETYLWSTETLTSLIFQLSTDSQCTHLIGTVLSAWGGSESKLEFELLDVGQAKVNTTYQLCFSFSNTVPFSPAGLRIHLTPITLDSFGPFDRHGEYTAYIPSTSPFAVAVSGSGISTSTTLFLSLNESSVGEGLLSLQVYQSFSGRFFFALFPPIGREKIKYFTSLSNPLSLQLYDSGTRLVYSTGFTVGFKVRGITSIANSYGELPSHYSMHPGGVAQNLEPLIVYGSSSVLVVTGYQIEGGSIIPALNCSVPSTFLWSHSVTLSSIEPYPPRGFDSDGQTDYKDIKYAYLTKNETTQFTVPASFEWCERYVDEGDVEWTSTGLRGYASLPAVRGLISETERLIHEARLSRSETTWYTLRLAFQISMSVIAPIFIKLSPASIPCEESLLQVAPLGVSGSFTINSHSISSGTYKVCYAVCSSWTEVPSSYHEVPLAAVKISVDDSPVPFITLLNGTTHLRVNRQSQLMSVESVGLTPHSAIQLVSENTICSGLSLSYHPVPIITWCNGYVSTSFSCRTTMREAFLTKDYLESLRGDTVYKVCFLSGGVWLPSPVFVEVSSTVIYPSASLFWSSMDIKSLVILTAATPLTNDTMARDFRVSQGTVLQFLCDGRKCKDGLRIMFVPSQPTALLETCGPLLLYGGLVSVSGCKVNEAVQWSMLLEVEESRWKLAEGYTFSYSEVVLSNAYFTVFSDGSETKTHHLAVPQYTSQFVALSGIEMLNMKICFGNDCELTSQSNVPEPSPDHLRSKWEISITSGAFLVPFECARHLQSELPVYLSFDGGVNYQNTALTFSVVNNQQLELSSGPPEAYIVLSDRTSLLTTFGRLHVSRKSSPFSRDELFCSCSNTTSVYGNVSTTLKVAAAQGSVLLGGHLLTDICVLSNLADPVHVERRFYALDWELKLANNDASIVSQNEPSFFVAVENQINAIQFHLSGLRHFADDCVHHATGELYTVCRMNSLSSLKRMNSIRFRFTTSTCDGFSDTYPSLSPTWLPNGDLLLTIPPHALPPSPLVKKVQGSTCVTVDGVHYLTAEIGYFTVPHPGATNSQQESVTDSGATGMDLAQRQEPNERDASYPWNSECRVKETTVLQSDAGALFYFPRHCLLSVPSTVRVTFRQFTQESCKGELVQTESISVQDPSLWTGTHDNMLTFMWPHVLHYFPDGKYSVCVGPEQIVVLYVDNQLLQLTEAASGIVAVYQGAPVDLHARGRAVNDNTNIYIGFSQMYPNVDLEQIFLKNTCEDVYERTQGTGHPQTLLSRSIFQANRGWLHLSAAMLKHESVGYAQTICYSLNGIVFHALSPLIILPPTLYSAVPYNASGFSLLPSLTSTATHLQRFTFGLQNSTATVVHSMKEGGGDTVMVQPPLFFVNSSLGFQGYGMGSQSKRNIESLSSPTFAASVAMMKSSEVGSSCSNLMIDESFELSVPVFVLNLATGMIWSNDDEEFYQANWESRGDLLQMNPVLTNSTWRNFSLFLSREGGLTDRIFDIKNESAIIPCVSLDGLHYFSSNWEAEASYLFHNDELPLILIPESQIDSFSPKRVSTLLWTTSLHQSCDNLIPNQFSIEEFKQLVAEELMLDPALLIMQIQAAGCVQGLGATDRQALPLFVITVVVSGDMRLPLVGGVIAPASEILLNLTKWLRRPTVIPRISLLASQDQLSLQVVSSQFYFSNGSLLESVMEPSDGTWYHALQNVPTAAVGVGKVSPELTSEYSSSPVGCLVVLALFSMASIACAYWVYWYLCLHT